MIPIPGIVVSLIHPDEAAGGLSGNQHFSEFATSNFESTYLFPEADGPPCSHIQHCEHLTITFFLCMGPYIKDVRTEGGGGVGPKADIVREVAWIYSYR